MSVVGEVMWRFSAGGVPAEAWSVVSVDTREALSELYCARLILAMETGGDALDGMLGAPARLDTARGPQEHALHGVVRAVEELGSTASHRLVRVEVVPSLWLLSLRSDNRIFQELSVPDVIRAVLADAGVYPGARVAIDPSVDALTPREYLVQYGESDLDFVRRLLEDEGVPFRFSHDDDGGEVWHLCGDEHAWPDAPTLDGAPARVVDGSSATREVETVAWFDEQHALGTAAVTVRDYDFTRPRATLDMTARHGGGRRARYEYPARSALARYDEGGGVYGTHNTPRLAKVRAEEHLCRQHTGRGRGNLAGLRPGARLTLLGHERLELDVTYLVTAVEHRGSAWHVLPESVEHSERLRDILDEAGVPLPVKGEGARYTNRFRTHRIEGSESSVPFRPARVTPRPIVEGPQTARVVGPEGEDIYTDAHGRIKVQFFWDRLGREDARSSCWIRVSQLWGGGEWGFAFIPRIGMEVVVAFLEGDPDRPLVTGCVYNGENAHATPFPAAKTKSGFRTWSTPRTGGYNEMRFEDAAGAEQVYTQAERDHDTLVKHDQTLTVQRHRTKRVQGEEFNTVEQNRVSHVMQSDTFTVDGNQDTEVHGPQGASLTVDNDHRTEVGGNQSVSVSQNHSVTVSQNQSVTVAMMAQETVGMAKAQQVGLAYQITVGARFEIVCGLSRFSMDALGNISISGEKIDISAKGPVAINGSIVDIN
jgi:type VI secretion system secreted protein VgrG